MTQATPVETPLSQRGFSALRWNYFGSAVRNLSQLFIGILLARLLGPEPFGIVALAWLILGVGSLISDLGFGAALVQRKELTEQDLRFVFTVQVAIGTALSLSGMLLAPVIANFFHKPEATPVLMAMFSLFLLQSFGQTSAALLRRALDFKRLQQVSVASYLVGYVAVGVPAAWLGLGVWSLVAAQLMQSLLNALGLMFSAGVPMKPTWRAASPGLFGFGSRVVGANLASYGISNLDSLFIGRMQGVTDLGFYNRAMMLVASPMNMVTTGLQGVLFSACSQIQADKGRLMRAYTGATTAIALVCLPIFLTVAMVPETVILGLYGDQWAAAIPVLAPLALAMPVNALLAVVGPVLMARDRVVLELRAQVITLLLMLPVLYLTSRLSLAAVAWGILGIYLLRLALLARALLSELGGHWAELGRAILWPVSCALFTALSTTAVDQSLSHTPAMLRLAIDIGVAVVVLLVMLRLVGKRLLDSPLGEQMLAVRALPMPLRRFLQV